MDYYSIQGSCLLSILLPSNFCIGEYIKMCRKKNIKHWYIDIVVLIISIAVVSKLIYDKQDPYISFIVMGGVLIGIIQNSYIYRNAPIELSFEKYLSIILGFVIIGFPNLSFFKEWILSDMCNAVRIMCHAFYITWGLEKIVFGIIDIHHNHKKKNKI